MKFSTKTPPTIKIYCPNSSILCSNDYFPICHLILNDVGSFIWQIWSNKCKYLLTKLKYIVTTIKVDIKIKTILKTHVYVDILTVCVGKYVIYANALKVKNLILLSMYTCVNILQFLETSRLIRGDHTVIWPRNPRTTIAYVCVHMCVFVVECTAREVVNSNVNSCRNSIWCENYIVRSAICMLNRTVDTFHYKNTQNWTANWNVHVILVLIESTELCSAKCQKINKYLFGIFFWINSILSFRLRNKCGISLENLNLV